MKQKLTIATCLLLIAQSDAAPSGTLYSIGSPTAKEQLYVELINRARLNPPAEGIRLDGYYNTQTDIFAAYDEFGVDRTMMKSEFYAIAAAQPLSISAKLTTAARLHSQYQIDSDQQTHTGSGSTTTGQRVTAAGYSWSTVGENVFASSNRPLHGHAAFNVDWGGGSGGMQTGRGHRANIHNDSFREIGIGNKTSAETTIPSGNLTATGAEIVTQDFAAPSSGATPFITGVVYYDLNGNSFYDIGEGIGGVSVGVTGSTFYAVTAASGGYSVPVPGNGTYPVEFWMPGASSASHSTSTTITSLKNKKIDWSPTYTAPVVSGSLTPAVGVASSYTFTTIAPASNYTFKAQKIVSSPTGENADSGASGYTASAGQHGFFEVKVLTASFGNSFHFGNTDSGYSMPTLVLNRKFTPKAGSTSALNFKSRLRNAQTSQIARVQILPEGAAEWINVWSQAGTGGTGETSFLDRSVNLDAYDGKEIQIRFAYDWSYGFASGNWTATTVGWWVDDITVANIDELTTPTTSTVTTSPASFLAASAGSYRLSVRPNLQDPLYGPTPSAGLVVNASTPTSGYYAWSYFATVGAPENNFDSDGLTNLLEYAFDTNPTVAQGNVISVSGSTVTRGAPTLRMTNTPGDVDFRVLFGRRTDATGLVYTVQFSGDMTTWVNSSAVPTILATDGAVQAVTVPYPFFVAGKKARFFRVVVTLAP